MSETPLSAVPALGQAVVVGARVRKLGDPSAHGTVVKRQNRRIRVDFTASGGPSSAWLEVTEIECCRAGDPSAADRAAGPPLGGAASKSEPAVPPCEGAEANSITDVVDRVTEREAAPDAAEPVAKPAAVQADNEAPTDKHAEDHDADPALDRDASDPEPDRSLPVQDVVDRVIEREAAPDAAELAAATKIEVGTEQETDVGDGEADSGAVAEKGTGSAAVTAIEDSAPQIDRESHLPAAVTSTDGLEEQIKTPHDSTDESWKELQAVAVGALKAANTADHQHDGTPPPDLVREVQRGFAAAETALLKFFDAPNAPEAALAMLRPKLQTVQQRLEDLSAVSVADPTVASGATSLEDALLNFSSVEVSAENSPQRSQPDTSLITTTPSQQINSRAEEANPPVMTVAAASDALTVCGFLENCKLAKFSAQLLEFGAEDVEDLRQIEASDLDDLGFKPLEKKRFFKALKAARPESVKLAEAETPKESDRERRQSIQDDLEAAFGSTDISLQGDLGSEASPVDNDPYASLESMYGGGDPETRSNAETALRSSQQEQHHGEKDANATQIKSPGSPATALEAMTLGRDTISANDLRMQEESLAKTRDAIDREQTRALNALERQEEQARAAQELQTKITSEAEVDHPQQEAKSLDVELPSYLESGLSTSQNVYDRTDLRTVQFQDGSLGMGLGVNETFRNSGDRLDQYSTIVERLNVLPDGRPGAAESSGAVHIRDLVATVNGEDLAGKDHGQVIGHIRASRRPLEIGFLSTAVLAPLQENVSEEIITEEFVQLVAEELQWDLDAPLSTKETIDRACADLGIDIENTSMHDAADLVAKQLGIPPVVNGHSISINNNNSLASVAEAPEEEVETPSPREQHDSPTPQEKVKARALARARARQEASRKLTDEEATSVLFEEQKRRIDWLKQVPIFQDVSSKPQFIADLAKKFQVRTVRKGTIIIEKGDMTGTEMYFVARGAAEVLNTLEGPAFSKLTEGSYCGESALLEDGPRNAYVRIQTDTAKLYALDRDNLQLVLNDHPAIEKIICRQLEERRVTREAAEKQTSKPQPKYYESHTSTGNKAQDEFIARQGRHLTERERKLHEKREQQKLLAQEEQALLSRPRPKPKKKRASGPLSPRNKVKLSGAAIASFTERMEELEKQKQAKLERRRTLEHEREQRQLQTRPKIPPRSHKLAKKAPRQARESRRLQERARTIKSKVNGEHLASLAASELSSTVNKDHFITRVEEDLYRRSAKKAQLQRRFEEEEAEQCPFEPDLTHSVKKQRRSSHISRLQAELQQVKHRQEPRPPAGMSLETQRLIEHTTKWIATHGPDFEDVVRKQKHGVRGWEFMDFHT
eukprot:COSAG02_NODE_3968_length_5975_cov_18.110279_1_plen_1346_part_10